MAKLDGEFCPTGKACFPNLPAAERSMGNIKRGSNRRQSSPVRAYRCDRCRWFHTTSLSEWNEE